MRAACLLVLLLVHEPSFSSATALDKTGSGTLQSPNAAGTYIDWPCVLQQDACPVACDADVAASQEVNSSTAGSSAAASETFGPTAVAAATEPTAALATTEETSLGSAELTVDTADAVVPQPAQAMPATSLRAAHDDSPTSLAPHFQPAEMYALPGAWYRCFCLMQRPALVHGPIPSLPF